jgi:hypothetical protein
MDCQARNLLVMFRRLIRAGIRHAAVLTLAACVLLLQSALAAPIHFIINTPGLSGVTGSIAFDLINGGMPYNQASIEHFLSDGTLGAHQTIGTVSGQLPGSVLLTDDDFFNEYSQEFAFGNELSFTLNATERPAAGVSFPDGVAFFLLDPSTGRSLITTSDPTGANALFLLSIGATPGLALYQATDVAVTLQVEPLPEPTTLILMLAGLAILAPLTRRRARGSDCPAVTAVQRSAAQRGSALRCLLAALTVLVWDTASGADVTAASDIKRSGLVLNRSTNTFDSTITVTNVGQRSLLAPLRLIVTATPNNVSLANGTGVLPDGRAYIDIPLPSGRLNQGQSVRTTLKMHNLAQVTFNVAFAVDASVDESPGLPPDPGPAGEVTLLGVDIDQDGVRDDIQRYIALTYPSAPNAVQALRQLSRTYQAMLTTPTGSATSAKTVNLAAWRNRACLVYLYGAADGHRRAQALFVQQFNTLARYRAWSQQDDLLAGEVFESPPVSASNCDFAVTR